MNKFIYTAALLTSIYASGAHADHFQWNWVRSDAVNGEWITHNGHAKLKIDGEKISGTLYNGENPNDIAYTISGQIKINNKNCQKNATCVLPVNISVVTENSDRGNNEFKGTYKIVNYSKIDAINFKTKSVSYILVNDTFNTISLTQRIDLGK